MPVAASEPSATAHSADDVSEQTRAAARELVPRRNLWIWVHIGVVAAVCVIGVLANVRAGSLGLAGYLALCGVMRLSLQGNVPGLTVRSRWIDGAVYWGLASMMAVLAVTAPMV